MTSPSTSPSPSPSTEHAHGRAVLDEMSPLHRSLRRAVPAVYEGFVALHQAAFGAGALDVRTKELIALAIGVVEGCDGCIASHAQAAVRAGATRQEAAEAIGVTFLMKGGPATIHGPRAYAAFCEFVDTDGPTGSRVPRMDDPTAALDRAHVHAVAYLDGLDERPVWPRATYEEMLERLGGDLPAHGQDPAGVVDDLAAAAEPGLVASTGGRFFGFVIGGTLPAALGADWLTSVWDQNAGLSSTTPAAAAAEVVAGRWIVEALGLPTGTAVGFVTGGMMANYTCLSAARHEVLARAGWNVATRGLFDAPRITVVVGRSRHDTIDRAVRYLGIGQDAVAEVDTDDQGRIEVAALASTLAATDGPTIVCLQAGEVHTGAFDPFVEAVALAHQQGAWVHVDGAFGLWAAASPSYRYLTHGMAAADSWATDAHKTLNVPYDSGLALVRDPAALVAGFGVEADYLIGGVGDPMERVPEFSRRARGFPVWAALRSLGRDGLADLVDRLCARATRLADGLRATEGAEVLNDVVFTQVLVAFGDDARTADVGRRLLADGTAVITPATWRGHVVQRCALSGWATSEADIDATLDAVRRLLAAD